MYAEIIRQYEECQFLILCTSKIGNAKWRCHAIHNGSRWEVLPKSFDLDQRTLGEVPEFALASRPQIEREYTYFTIANLATNTMPTAELTTKINQIVKAHDQNLNAPIQSGYPIISDLLSTIERHEATLLLEITFDDDIPWRAIEIKGVAPLDMLIQPDEFAASLRAVGWRQTMPPVHQRGKRYNILLERSEGRMYRISDRTDVQEENKRRGGLLAHAVMEMRRI